MFLNNNEDTISPPWHDPILIFIFFKGDVIFLLKILFIFREREGREKEGERSTNVWLPHTHPLTEDLAQNPGMRPDWEWNW